MYYDPCIVMATRNLQSKIYQNCPSSRDFSLLWAQITVPCPSWKGVCLIDSFSTENPTNKGRDIRKVSVLQRCPSRESWLHHLLNCWRFANFNPTTTNQRAVGIIKMSLSEKKWFSWFLYMLFESYRWTRISSSALPCTSSVYINCSFNIFWPLKT